MDETYEINYIVNLLYKKIENTDIDLTEEEADNIPKYANSIRKKLRLLDLILLKEVDIKLIDRSDDVDEYNMYMYFLQNHLTEEQYKRIKEAV